MSSGEWRVASGECFSDCGRAGGRPRGRGFATESRPLRAEMKRMVLGLIRLYQHTLAKALPENTCRFYPTCSHYGYEAIEKYGVIKGGGMAAWRIMRCNPWNQGGFDPVK